MTLSFLLCLVALSAAVPLNSLERRGNLPLVVSSSEFLGNVHSTTTYVLRDLGFQGKIGDTVLLTYGDTLYSDASYSSTFRGMTSDSVAIATDNPLQVKDINLNAQDYPEQFCPIEAKWGEEATTDAMGITNVVETNPGEGVLYFLKNHRPNGQNTLIGAGVATVSLSSTNVPNATRLAEYWWDANTEPWYGDIGALRAGDYIYAYGHAQSANHAYVTRVNYTQATQLDSYEYWNGQAWQSDRMYNVSDKESVMWGVDQGQVFWSGYYGCFVFVYCDNFVDNKVMASVSYSPTGPWSDAVMLYQATPITAGGNIYSAVPHPYYDASGKTLVVTFTNEPNDIQAVKVTFD